MKIIKMVFCIKNRFEFVFILNNGGDLIGYFLDVFVLGDGVVEVFWFIQRQLVNVCYRERKNKLMYIVIFVISNIGNLFYCLFLLYFDV